MKHASFDHVAHFGSFGTEVNHTFIMERGCGILKARARQGPTNGPLRAVVTSMYLFTALIQRTAVTEPWAVCEAWFYRWWYRVLPI